MTKMKAIIFDCDGTLVDSEEAHFQSWRRAIQLWGGNLTPEEYLLFAGKAGTHVAAFLAQSTEGVNAEEIFSEKQKFYDSLLEKGIPPIPGTLGFVKKVIENSKGFKLGVASAAPKHEILKNLKNLDIDQGFDVILSGHEDLKGYSDPEGVNKPKPYIYLHAAKLLGLNPEDLIVIEDSHTGVTAASTAGCFTIAVPNAHTKQQDLSKASLKIETLDNLTLEQFLSLTNTAGSGR